MEGEAEVTLDLLEAPKALQRHIVEALCRRKSWEAIFPPVEDQTVPSSVMFLLAHRVVRDGAEPTACIILNRRSRKVRQPGDLCCPGGTVEMQLDPYLARLLRLPGSPLRRWPYWSRLHRRWPREARLTALYLAAALRESWEEMRLNPLRVRFLGPLPAQRLMMFQRVIHPLVGWVTRQEHFRPSWEVERIVTIPLRALLNPAYYACYRLYVPSRLEPQVNHGTQDFPCFLYRYRGEPEILWGATYKIVTFFLELMFGFVPPAVSTLPMVPGILDEGYINGREQPARRSTIPSGAGGDVP